MDARKPPLEIVYSATANREIQAIWKYNAEFYNSREHATEYVDFLYESIEGLSTGYQGGKTVETNAALRYLVIKRSSSGHGHVAIYRVTKKGIRILHIFHTSRNWTSKVKSRKR